MAASEVFLPDDALLNVLAYLPSKELLACRLVCRRFRDLCLHPDLWRSVMLSDKELLVALPLVPCLKQIMFSDGHVFRSLAQLASMVSNITCVVAEISCIISEQVSVPLVTAIVQKVYDMGGLRSLDIYGLQEIELPDSFFRMIYAMHNLDSLALRLSTAPQVLLLPAREKPSLTKLTYGCDSGPFVNLLLKAHASTLQHLSLLCGGHLPTALGEIKAPALRTFCCHLNKDLTSFQALSNLHKLTLIAYEEYPFPPKALGFLRRCSQLRSVRFTLLRTLPTLLEPLLALAASPSASVLEMLTVKCRSDSLAAMAATLHRFPSLQSVTLESFKSFDELPPTLNARLSDDFLRTVSPATAPRLSTLSMDPVPGCPHNWLHGPAVMDLLARNPGLHLRLCCKTSQHCDCQWCRWGCHEELKTQVRRAFASHSRAAECPKDCFRWPV